MVAPTLAGVAAAHRAVSPPWNQRSDGRRDSFRLKWWDGRAPFLKIEHSHLFLWRNRRGAAVGFRAAVSFAATDVVAGFTFAGKVGQTDCGARIPVVIVSNSDCVCAEIRT
jgi:hypothetical protein